jgi:hypothetical protein
MAISEERAAAEREVSDLRRQLEETRERLDVATQRLVQIIHTLSGRIHRQEEGPKPKDILDMLEDMHCYMTESRDAKT